MGNSTVNRLNPPRRVLLGPGPSDVAPSVLAALAAPTVGHLDPAFLSLMDEVRAMTREVFQTENELTMPISGTGSAGMETCLVNLLEPGDRVLCGVNGVFGGRMAEVARRCGAEVTEVNADWGRSFSVSDFEAAAEGSYKLVCVVHAETSTGVLQDLTGMRALADSLGALLVVDAVTSTGGLPVKVDAWGIDAIYSGTQKCLSCPPGLSPVSFSPRAVEVMAKRSRPVQSWYLDLSLIGQYWGAERAYHHTAPINMVYGFHEALRLVLEEGLEARFERHRNHSRMLIEGLSRLGLEMFVEESERLPTLHSVRIPEGIDEAAVRKRLLHEYGVEIGAGLGPLSGKVWRIGLMGESSRPGNVALCLRALEDLLQSQR